MKINSNIVSAILAIIIVVISVMYYREHKTNSENMKGIQTLMDQKVKLYINKIGELTAEVKQSKVDRKTAQIVAAPRIDSISKQLGIKKKNITENQKIDIQTDRKLDIGLKHDTRESNVINKVDAVDSFYYRDEWLTIKGTIDKDSLKIDSLRTINKLSITHFEAKPHWYSLSKETHVAVSDENKHTSNIGMNSLVIKNKPKRFVVSSGIGYGYTPVSNKFTMSIDLIHIGVKLFDF